MLGGTVPEYRTDVSIAY